MPHVISTSGRKSYRGCRRRWDWLFNGYYYPQTTAKPLEFGVAYHRAMEIYYNPATWHIDRQVMTELAVQEFLRKCAAQRKKALQVMEEVRLEPDVQQDYDERVVLGQGMLRYHLGHVAPQADVGFKPVKVELRAQLPITDPATGEPLRCLRRPCSHTPDDNVVEYVIRVDCLAEDQFGDYWITDWKTARTISDDTEFTELDDQIGSYVWAFREIGVPVRGFLYHEQKKGFPQRPNENKTRRLGCKFSVSKQQDTDYETYLRTVSIEDKEAYEAGAYDDFLYWLQEKGVTYWQRLQIHKSDTYCRSVHENIFLEAKEMVDPNLPVYPSPGRFACRGCAFRTPCMMKFNGEDFLYTLNSLYDKRSVHYYDEVEPSTESKAGE